MENAVFHCLVEERKQERPKIGEKVFLPTPTFFILPNWEENQEEKVMRNACYTNTPTLLHSPIPLTFPLLYNKDIIVNLYKLHFPSSTFSLQPNKKVFHPFNQTHMRENQIFSILPLIFHPSIFPLLQPNRPLISLFGLNFF